MSALALKIIAMITMLIDHTFAACVNPGRLDIFGIGRIMVPGAGISLYWLGRTIGRIAFPIFCFQIAEGVRYTRNWKRYLGRLALLALLSEIPFDLALKGAWLNTMYQNVFFTLLLGMLIVTFMKEQKGIWKYAAWPFLVYGLGWVAENILHTDYGMSGVTAIAVMGLMNEPWERLFKVYTPQIAQLIHVVFAALGIYVLYFHNSFEIYGFLALLPIALYNGSKGYSNRWIQYGFYLFYPVHLLILGLVACSFR